MNQKNSSSNPFTVLNSAIFLAIISLIPFVGDLKKEGESCGSCFCPPKFTAGECDTGLKCDRSAQKFLPDAPGICRAEKKGEGILPLFGPYF